MTWKSRWIPLLLIAGSLISGASVPALPDSGPLAVIAGKTVTSDSFRGEMARRGGEFDQERKRELLDSIVRSELLFAAAKSAGYENDPEVIEAFKQAMVGKYLQDNLEPKLAQLKVTDKEAHSYYLANQADFGTPAMVRAALIRVAVSPKASAEKKTELLKRAESARAEALALEPGVPAFGSVAVTYSDDQESRYRGGDIGWLQAGTVDGRRDRKVSDAIFALAAPGQISAVITADDGYYIVKLMESKGASVKPFAQVKDGVRYQALQEKKREVEQGFIAELKREIPVTVNRGLLPEIARPGDGKKPVPPDLPAR
jgi:parvulin-like peptidyl-prolyl isomerase